MKEQGGHFVRAYALALAAHALLFLLLAALIRSSALVPAGGMQPVEIQLSGPRPAGGSGGPGTAPAQAPAPRPPAPARAVTRLVPAPAPPAPAPAPARSPAPAPAESPAPAPAEPPAPAPADLPGQADWGDTAGGPGGMVGAGGGASGGAGGAAGGPPGTISDIDPAPIQPISAGYPAAARRLGQQGLVKIQAEIDSRGQVVDCKVIATSGFPSLDNAALQAVKAMRFLPARRNGKTISSGIIIPVRFKLTEN